MTTTNVEEYGITTQDIATEIQDYRALLATAEPHEVDTLEDELPPAEEALMWLEGYHEDQDAEEWRWPVQ